VAEFLGDRVEPENTAGNGALKPEIIVINRRSFFGALLAIGSAGMGALLAVPVLRYVLYPLYAKAAGTEWSEVGDLGEFSNAKGPLRKTITRASRALASVK